MPSSKTYQIRISETDKKETFEVFKSLGITPAQAVKMFFAQVRQTKSIPFPIESRYYNEKTEKLLLMNDTEKAYTDFNTVDDLFAELKS